MKVIWKDTIVDKLIAVREGAIRNNKQVECIMLSRREWDELADALKPMAAWSLRNEAEVVFMGMKIKRWEFA